MTALPYLANPVYFPYRPVPAGPIEWVTMIDVEIPQIAQEFHLTQEQAHFSIYDRVESGASGGNRTHDLQVTK